MSRKLKEVASNNLLRKYSSCRLLLTEKHKVVGTGACSSPSTAKESILGTSYMPTGISADLMVSRGLSFRHVKRWSKRIGLLATAVYFMPTVLVVYVVCGLLDF